MLSLVDSSTKACGRRKKKKKKRSCFFQIPTSSFKPNIYHSWVTRHAVKIVRETWQISRVYLAFLRFTRLMGFTLGLRLSVLFSFPRADLSLVKSITLSRLVMFLIRSKYNSFFFFIHLRPQNINFSKTLYCIKETVKIIRRYFSIVKSQSFNSNRQKSPISLHHLRYEEGEKGIARA